MTITKPLDIPHKRPFLEKTKVTLRKRWYGRKRKPGPGNVVRARYFGADLIVNLDEEVGYEIAINRYEWRELKLMLDACNRLKPELFIDVGANLGLFSCVLGRHKAVARILAFEPDRANFERLNANLKLNKLSEIAEAREVGAGAKGGAMTLVPSGPDNRGMSRIDQDAGDGAYAIEMIAIDDVLRLDGSRFIAKIDVEGHELEVLMGAAQLFTRNGGYAQIEAQGNRLAGVITELMSTFGWRLIERYGLNIRFEKP